MENISDEIKRVERLILIEKNKKDEALINHRILCEELKQIKRDNVKNKLVDWFYETYNGDKLDNIFNCFNNYILENEYKFSDKECFNCGDMECFKSALFYKSSQERIKKIMSKDFLTHKFSEYYYNLVVDKNRKF